MGHEIGTFLVIFVHFDMLIPGAGVQNGKDHRFLQRVDTFVHTRNIVSVLITNGVQFSTINTEA